MQNWVKADGGLALTRRAVQYLVMMMMGFAAAKHAVKMAIIFVFFPFVWMLFLTFENIIYSRTHTISVKARS